MLRSAVLTGASQPIVLSIYERFYLPLQESLRPATKAFILALLPGLEEETGEFFEKVRRNGQTSALLLVDDPDRWLRYWIDFPARYPLRSFFRMCGSSWLRPPARGFRHSTTSLAGFQRWTRTSVSSFIDH